MATIIHVVYSCECTGAFITQNMVFWAKSVHNNWRYVPDWDFLIVHKSVFIVKQCKYRNKIEQIMLGLHSFIEGITKHDANNNNSTKNIGNI